MKKKTVFLILIMACILLLSACKCEHQWIEADCVTPRTCSECQETEGAPNGHSWMAASCEAPKTCEVCALTEEEAKGHSWYRKGTEGKQGHTARRVHVSESLLAQHGAAVSQKGA